MPIDRPVGLKRMTQTEFGALAYEVMATVFQIHKDFGPLFDEAIYKRELARRRDDVRLEVPVTLYHRGFRKDYFIDALAAKGGPFEFKAVEVLTPAHRAQVLNYLLLTDLSHAKLVNLRTESVQHEFLNTTLRDADRRQFAVTTDAWDESIDLARWFQGTLLRLLRDWGTGLDHQAYEEALLFLLGDHTPMLQEVEVRFAHHLLGRHRVNLVAPGVAFKLTALSAGLDGFAAHTRRILEHTSLSTMLWANITVGRVTFTTLRRPS